MDNPYGLTELGKRAWRWYAIVMIVMFFFAVATVINDEPTAGWSIGVYVISTFGAGACVALYRMMRAK